MALFGEYCYDPSKWRPSVPFVEQLKALQEIVDEGKVITMSYPNQLKSGMTVKYLPHHVEVV